MAKSEYLETLEKLQNALTQFDMSFGVSNRIFRLALVSEILDTVCLFEQLYESWSKYLPYGEGPDADVDFSYWKNLSSWDTLLDSAKQNACIDDFPLDMGNGVTSDRVHGNRRKTYLKTINSVLRHSKYAGKDSTSAFVKTINSDKTHMITFGNMVFDALSSLLLVFSKIETLLSNPPQELFLNFYEMQYNRFCEEWLSNRVRIVEILYEDLSDKRKCNKLYALKDEVWKNLYESNFLDALKDGINIYDIHDYQKEHPDTSKTEDEIREVLALAELVDSENRPYKEKVGKYIFEHRKSLSYEDICTFVVYLDAVPDILSNIEKLKEENCDETVAPQPIANDSTSEVEQVNPVVEAIKEQTEVLKKIAEQTKTENRIQLTVTDKEIKTSIKELLNAKDDENMLIFQNKKQWWAVYRVLFYFCNYPSQMTTFKSKMKELKVDEVDGKRDFSYESLSAASKEVPKMATCSPDTWNTLKDINDNYKQQYTVAEFLMLKLGIKS